MLGKYACLFLAVLPVCEPQPNSNQDLTIQESITPGTSVEVSSSLNLQGNVKDPKPNAKQGQSQMLAIRAFGQSHYRERLLAVAEKTEISTVARRYLVASLEKQRGEAKQTIQLRPGVERILLERVNDHSTIFSPDGPLTGPELDLLQPEPFVSALRGLLPAKMSKIGDQWEASNEAASELTGVDPIQSGKLQCTLKEVKPTNDGTVARIVFSGTLTGPTEQGPTRSSIEGYLHFDLDQQLISYLVMNGRSEILDASGRAVGNLEGRYELNRRPAIDDPRLVDSELKGVELKPTQQSTSLLFDGSTVGIQFRYPRNWELASVMKNAVEFDETTGGNMRLTIDASPAPTADKLRSDLMGWLKQQKATIKETDAVETQALSDSTTADRFSVRAEHQQKEKEWTYLIIRDGNRSVSIAANLIQERAEVLRDDLLFVARSVKFVEKQSGGKE
jgi:hypothetical protein